MPFRKRKSDLSPDAGHSACEVLDQSAIVCGSWRNSEPLRSPADRRIIDRLNIDAMPVE